MAVIDEILAGYEALRPGQEALAVTGLRWTSRR